MADEVLIAEADGVLEIVLNRPEQGNALTPGMADTISSALANVGPDVRVILLRAEGADFCTGRSAVMPEPGTRLTSNDLRGILSDAVLDFYAALRDAPVPMIAAVRGKAEGVGCAIVALADVAIAADSAQFVVPEMNRDIAPTLVMDALCDRLPRAALARLVLTRDTVDAAEAKALGVIGKTVPDDQLDAEVARVVATLCSNSTTTVRGVKAFLSRAPEGSHATRKELAALINSAAMAEKFR